jgi:uncharacterized membrane protein YdjX (TVP38/TMEM64 family)
MQPRLAKIQKKIKDLQPKQLIKIEKKIQKIILPKERQEYINRFIFFLIAIAIAVLFLYSVTLQETYYRLIDAAGTQIQQNHVRGIILFVIIEALAVMISPFSSVPLLFVAIGIWGRGMALFYSMIGGIIGAIGSYAIGSYALYRLLKRIIPISEIEYYRKRIAHRASFWIVLLFRLAMPVEIPGYVLGIARYPFWKYLLATAIAYVPFYALTIYAGDALIKKNTGVFIVMVATFAIFICLSLFFFFKKLKNMK